MKKTYALVLTLVIATVFVMAMTATTFAAEGTSGLSLDGISNFIDTLAAFVKKITTLPTLLNNLATAIETLKKAVEAIFAIF